MSSRMISLIAYRVLAVFAILQPVRQMNVGALILVPAGILLWWKAGSLVQYMIDDVPALAEGGLFHYELAVNAFCFVGLISIGYVLWGLTYLVWGQFSIGWSQYRTQFIALIFQLITRSVIGLVLIFKARNFAKTLIQWLQEGIASPSDSSASD